MIAPWLLYASVMGTAIVVVALLLERIARWRGSPTRWIWLAAILVIVALPAVLNLTVPAPAPVRTTRAGAVGGLTPIRRVRFSRINVDRGVVALWLIASTALAVRVLGGAMALRRRRKSWISAELSGTEVLLADELGPAVIGWTKLTTVIPRWALTFDEGSRALMLEHEAEHARSGDPYLRSIALVALILMPWNPAIWWAMRRMRLAVEIDCDGRVLSRGVDPHVYASLLLAVGERMSATPFAWATALGGSRSSLEKRIVAMSTQISPRYRRLATAGAGAAIVAVIAIACASPVPDPVVPPTAAVTQEKHAKSTAGSTFEVVADSIFFECEDKPAARADSSCTKGPRFYVSYQSVPPKDTVYTTYQGQGSIPASIEMDAECEIHSDCHGFIGMGHRNDTMFVFRTGSYVFLSPGRVDPSSDDLEIQLDRSVSAPAIMRGEPKTMVERVIEMPSVELVNSPAPKCTAGQLQARLHAKAGQPWPRCEPQ